MSVVGRISAQDLGLYSDADEAALAHVLQAVRAYAPIRVVVQLGHAGRKASSRAPWDGGTQLRPHEPSGWRTEAPSAVPHADTEDAPVMLDRVGLDRVRGDFAAAGDPRLRAGGGRDGVPRV